MAKSLHMFLTVCSDGSVFDMLQHEINNYATLTALILKLTQILDKKRLG